jgi:hypothetical protein
MYVTACFRYSVYSRSRSTSLEVHILIVSAESPGAHLKLVVIAPIHIDQILSHVSVLLSVLPLA